MSNPTHEFDPVTHVTAGAIGTPGHRTFYVQAEQGLKRVSLLCEKEQVRALAESIDEMMANLEEEFGVARHEDLVVDEAAMAIKEPVEPMFRVGAMALGYDASRDRILLVLQEALGEEESHDPVEVRLIVTRSQVQVLGSYAKDVVGQGRTTEQRVLEADVFVRRNGHDN